MIEHNNRDIAAQFAEYITGDELRQYVAKKVRKYCGEDLTIFDGAAGSGQLAQYIKPTHIEAVEIQKTACEALIKNFQSVNVTNDSFFNYQSDVICDAVIMNPPFSMRLKSLTEKEQSNVSRNFPWKKSGVVDDVFVLKSLKHTKRFGFYILFQGVCYRKTELKFRQLIGHQIVELNCIQNAFTDTTISVLFIVIDKQKTDQIANRELYDCKTKRILANDVWQIDSGIWQTVQVEQKHEVIDIDAVNAALIDHVVKQVDVEFRKNLVAVELFGATSNILSAINRLRVICDDCEAHFISLTP